MVIFFLAVLELIYSELSTWSSSCLPTLCLVWPPPSLLIHHILLICEHCLQIKKVCLTTAANTPLHNRHHSLLEDLDRVVSIVSVWYFQVFLLSSLPCNKSFIECTVSSTQSEGIISSRHWRYWDKDPCNLNSIALPAHGRHLVCDSGQGCQQEDFYFCSKIAGLSRLLSWILLQSILRTLVPKEAWLLQVQTRCLCTAQLNNYMSPI